MLTLTLIRGLPGSGKSTMAQKLIDTDNTLKWVEADHYFIDASGDYKFDPSELEDAHHWCLNAAKTHLLNGDSVVVSNTFTRRWEMKPYFDLAKQVGAEVKVVEAMGNYKSIHNVPQKTIDAMRSRWETV